MRSVVVVAAAIASAAAAVVAGPVVDHPAVQEMPASGTSAGETRARFSGLWRYNGEFSINPATGRPERAPAGSAPPPLVQPPANRVTPMAGAGAEAEVIAASPFGPSPRAIREHRDMVRDLMEIAETLELTIDDDAVTIEDDLERVRRYPTDGRFYEYRLGASAFRARVSWDGERLVREIQGTFGFRMRETWFLSPEGQRLFIIMRVDGIERSRPAVGADRVYDRVEIEAR
jgi:hypothetical protein